MVEGILQRRLTIFWVVLGELSDSSGDRALCMTQFVHRVCNKINYLLFDLRNNLLIKAEQGVEKVKSSLSCMPFFRLKYLVIIFPIR